MRQLFGVGSRSEVLRYLLTGASADVPAQDVAQAVAYAKRNVSETLAALVASGLVTTFLAGNERRYHLNREPWGQLLGLTSENWPTYRDWPAVPARATAASVAVRGLTQRAVSLHAR
jgi:Fe2+ or Zn2+ uptake regulation protein